jgi:oligopeptide/dipeptide ABC transporter ATP-binding protein
MTSTAPSKRRGEVLLDVQDLSVEFDTEAGVVRAVDGVSFTVHAGQTLGIVGESGCGKSVTAMSILRLLPRPMGRVAGGRILFRGEDLVTVPDARIQKVRTGEIGMIFQEPMTALNPVHRIGRQLSEAFLLHQRVTARGALERSVEVLKRVGIPSPEIRVSEYPHQLSGGMRQRVVIAMALACQPALVIADEPTTALDVTIQAQILELMKSLQQETGMSIILITHDLGVIAETCDDVLVMYAGRVAEQGTVEDVFDRPVHPYTRGLLESIPRLEYERKTRLRTIEGMVPGLLDLPAGCRFNNRCPEAQENCRETAPGLDRISTEHAVACHHWRRLPAWQQPVAPVTPGAPVAPVA